MMKKTEIAWRWCGLRGIRFACIWLSAFVFLSVGSDVLLSQDQARPETAAADTGAAQRPVQRDVYDLVLPGLFGFYPASYNRVDGLLAGWGFTLAVRKEISYPGTGITQKVSGSYYPDLSVSVLAPTARRFVGGSLEMNQPVSIAQQLSASLSLYSGSACSDAWRVSEPGTSLVYLFTGSDRRFFYGLKSAELSLNKKVGNRLGLRLGYFSQKVGSLGMRNVWTVLESSILKDNPPVREGHGRGLRLYASLDWLNPSPFFPEGLGLDLSVEKSGGLFGGDFDYSLWSFGALYALKPSRNNYLSARLTGKTATRELPPHKLFNLGQELYGLDTFDPEFRLFSRRGDRLWDLSLGYSRLFRPPSPSFLKYAYDWSLNLRLDSGVTFFSRDSRNPWTLFSDGLGHFDSSASVGAGFSVGFARIELYLSRSLNPHFRGSLVSLGFRGPGANQSAPY
jgi:hypothetical protein